MKIIDQRGQVWAVSTAASSLLTGAAEVSAGAKEGALWPSFLQSPWWIEREVASMGKGCRWVGMGRMAAQVVQIECMFNADQGGIVVQSAL
jgi:hypothetical protein